MLVFLGNISADSYSKVSAVLVPRCSRRLSEWRWRGSGSARSPHAWIKDSAGGLSSRAASAPACFESHCPRGDFLFGRVVAAVSHRFGRDLGAPTVVDCVSSTPMAERAKRPSTLRRAPARRGTVDTTSEKTIWSRLVVAVFLCVRHRLVPR